MLTITSVPKPSGISQFGFNLRKPPFNYHRIRYAFSYLFNRENMNRELFYGEYLLHNSVYPGSPYENPSNKKITFNPTKAM